MEAGVGVPVSWPFTRFLDRFWRNERGGPAVFTPVAAAFRFYDDDAGEAASTPLAAQDIDIIVDPRGIYQANGVTFDGTNDYLTRDADLTGSADSQLWSGSFWFKRGSVGSIQLIYANDPAVNPSTAIGFRATNELVMEGENDAGTVILDIETSAITDTASYHHCMFSVDLADTGKRHLYIDDASDLNVNIYTDDTMDFTEGDHAVGAASDGGFKFIGDLADLWIANGVYIDLSVEANRRKFITAAGTPVELLGDGSGPNGTAPIMFFQGATAGWETNKGTGGGFTENGALADASADPAAGDSFGDVLQLRYRIDETGSKDGDAGDDWQLRVDKNASTTFVDVSAASSNVRAAVDTDTDLTDGSATTNRSTDGISDPGAGSFVVGEQEAGNGLIEDHQLTADDFTEHVWALRLVLSDLADTDTLDFQVKLNAGDPGMTNSVTPRITVSMPPYPDELLVRQFDPTQLRM